MQDNDHSSATRRLWLLDLAEALEEAERLTGALASRRSGSREAILLRTRIKAARAEVEALQQGGINATEIVEIDPLWTLWPRPTPRHDKTP